MVWVTNAPSPYDTSGMLHSDWVQQVASLKGLTIGPPQATEKYSAQELQQMGMVGMYRMD